MISNQKQSGRILLTFTSISLGLIVVFALSFLELFESPMWIRLSLGALIGIEALYFASGGFYFLQLEVLENKELMVKYYNLFPIGRKFRAFKIPLSRLHHHEIKPGHGGLSKWIVFYQSMQGGLAKYPAVGFSAANNNFKTEVEDFLKELEVRG